MERKKKRPAKIELGRGELLIGWKDGRQSRYALADLRRECPCATCGELRKGAAAGAPGELTLIDETAASATAVAHRFDYVGRYGIRIHWADGHNYGIYTFAALRERDEEAEKPS